MSYVPPLFRTLPANRGELWARVARFLSVWRAPVMLESGIDPGELERTEATLGHQFPEVLREAFQLLGAAISKPEGGYLHERFGASFLAPRDCYELRDHGFVAIAEDYHGALYGIRSDDLGVSDPNVGCINDDRYQGDISRLSEFLVGVLFRSAVENAPYCLRIEMPEIERQCEVAERVERLLRHHFSAWERTNNDCDFGYPCHVEGPGLIAAYCGNLVLSIGLLKPSIMQELPSQLRAELIALSN